MKDLEGPISAFASQVSEAVELATETVEDQGEAARLALDSVGGLAESIADGVTLLRLVDDETPIPRNDAFGKGLVLLRDPVHVEQVGTTKLRVIGPAEHHLKRLRDEWRDWLERQPASTRRGDTGRTATRGTGEESAASTLPMSPPEARTVVRELAAAAAAAACGRRRHRRRSGHHREDPAQRGDSAEPSIDHAARRGGWAHPAPHR